MARFWLTVFPVVRGLLHGWKDAAGTIRIRGCVRSPSRRCATRA